MTSSKQSRPGEMPRREMVRIVLDPRGFYKTEPVFEWIAAVDPALGDDYTTLVKWVKGKILEVMTVPKEWL